ncbi:hypothetical protein C7M84_024218 [Penaeus vannamei]|uniref:Uncharacterized protein n=1 Tax=Penaeus vannamei TaxID=6689 RepID=A0A423U1T2_PENVA|nr:hypothetical protein C7M84_024218 [Penaeus vannamei]
MTSAHAFCHPALGQRSFCHLHRGATSLSSTRATFPLLSIPLGDVFCHSPTRGTRLLSSTRGDVFCHPPARQPALLSIPQSRATSSHPLPRGRARRRPSAIHPGQRLLVHRTFGATSFCHPPGGDALLPSPSRRRLLPSTRGRPVFSASHLGGRPSLLPSTLGAHVFLPSPHSARDAPFSGISFGTRFCHPLGGAHRIFCTPLGNVFCHPLARRTLFCHPTRATSSVHPPGERLLCPHPTSRGDVFCPSTSAGQRPSVNSPRRPGATSSAHPTSAPRVFLPSTRATSSCPPIARRSFCIHSGQRLLSSLGATSFCIHIGATLLPSHSGNVSVIHSGRRLLPSTLRANVFCHPHRGRRLLHHIHSGRRLLFNPTRRRSSRIPLGATSSDHPLGANVLFSHSGRRLLSSTRGDVFCHPTRADVLLHPLGGDVFCIQLGAYVSAILGARLYCHPHRGHRLTASTSGATSLHPLGATSLPSTRATSSVNPSGDSSASSATSSYPLVATSRHPLGRRLLSSHSGDVFCHHSGRRLLPSTIGATSSVIHSGRRLLPLSMKKLFFCHPLADKTNAFEKKKKMHRPSPSEGVRVGKSDHLFHSPS